ncbi:hypothetical protein BHE74_00009731 [Ensete ventricosum]|nr:hypothetical protein BHE74_00009731 [Ensete ventricosum]
MPLRLVRLLDSLLSHQTLLWNWTGICVEVLLASAGHLFHLPSSFLCAEVSLVPPMEARHRWVTANDLLTKPYAAAEMVLGEATVERLVKWTEKRRDDGKKTSVLTRLRVNLHVAHQTFDLCIFRNGCVENCSMFVPDISSMLPVEIGKASASLYPEKENNDTSQNNVISALAPPKDVDDLRLISGYGNVNIFTYSELRVATKNFRPDQVLGEGGFGVVYKGVIDESVRPGSETIQVAVKELKSDGLQGDKEWLVISPLYFFITSKPNLRYFFYQHEVFFTAPCLSWQSQ